MSDRLLLVEGEDEKRVLPQLLERAGIGWGARGHEVVKIMPLHGFENFTQEEIQLQLKNGGLTNMAIVVDADQDPSARWQSLCERLRPWFPDIPLKAPPEGINVVPSPMRDSPRLRRFGVWMMPNNQAGGMLETFLLSLRPAPHPDMAAHVADATDRARILGAEHGVFKPVHRDKALIHTWLAWHGDPPGRQLHQAIIEKTLDPTLPFAKPFVTWFKAVFELP